MGAISEIFGYVLNALYNLINNYGVAILIFSVLLRLILIPITYKQQKSMKKTNELQEEMKSFQVKYKNNPEEMNRATMELYKREGISPFSGCLSGILQIIIILSVFWLVSQPLRYMRKVQDTDIYKEYETKISENKDEKIPYKEIAIIDAVETDYKEIKQKLENEEYIKEDSNTDIETEESRKTTTEQELTQNVENKEELQTKEELENRKNELEQLRINMNFLGLDLSKVPTSNLGDWKTYIIPILYVITSFISIRMTTRLTNSKKEEETEQEASMKQMNKTMSYMMPIMSISIASVAPLGLALYWLASNILMIIERLVMNKIVESKEEEKNV